MLIVSESYQNYQWGCGDQSADRRWGLGEGGGGAECVVGDSEYADFFVNSDRGGTVHCTLYMPKSNDIAAP
jgi:hypothetical protein